MKFFNLTLGSQKTLTALYREHLCLYMCVPENNLKIKLYLSDLIVLLHNFLNHFPFFQVVILHFLKVFLMSLKCFFFTVEKKVFSLCLWLGLYYFGACLNSLKVLTFKR